MQYKSWDVLLGNLKVPELGQENYIKRALQDGALITLYTFATQIILSNDAKMIKKLRGDLLKWIKKIEIIPGESVEYKIFLLVLLFVTTTFNEILHNHTNMQLYVCYLYNLIEDQ